MKGKRVRIIFVVIGLSLLFENQVLAQDQTNVVAQANNPLANMTAFNIQNYYIGDLLNGDDPAFDLSLCSSTKMQ
jgi:hypothetical protein